MMGSLWLQALRACTLLGLVMSLAGCASPYARQGLFGGYTEEKISPGIYRVAYNGNGHTNEQTVVSYWLYRCAELTLAEGYSFFGVRSERRSELEAPGIWNEDWLPAERPVGALPDMDAPGDSQGQPMRVRYVGPTYVYVPSYTRITTWHKNAVIMMFHTRVAGTAPEQAFALHAQTVVEMLKPFVESGGKSAAPAPREVIDAAMHLAPVPARPSIMRTYPMPQVVPPPAIRATPPEPLPSDAGRGLVAPEIAPPP